MMRRLLTAVLLFAAAACGGSPAGPRAGESVRISGVVQDFSTGAPVTGASVTFGDATAVTNASGIYQIAVAALERYTPSVDGVRMGGSAVFGPDYRGDFLVRGGTCVARYGTVSDLGLHRPIPGAVVSIGGRTTTTGADGWYRLDFGCPAEDFAGGNTTSVYVTHPDYAPVSQLAGRGLFGVFRSDIEMQRK